MHFQLTDCVMDVINTLLSVKFIADDQKDKSATLLDFILVMLCLTCKLEHFPK